MHFETYSPYFYIKSVNIVLLLKLRTQALNNENSAYTNVCGENSLGQLGIGTTVDQMDSYSTLGIQFTDVETTEGDVAAIGKGL